MRYLMCIRNGKERYTEVSDEQERKISKLIQAKEIPSQFQLNGKTIISDEILGFTDSSVPTVPQSEKPTIRNFEDLRSYVYSQPWYRGKRSSEDTESIRLEAQPDKISLG